jgi:energy-coupling factor transporter ATP-binding protein EcfA2
MSVIDVKDLTFKYPYSDKLALKNISFRIHRGEFVLLAGASGCGKTTLARALIGLIPQFYEGEYSGSVRILGMNPSNDPISKISMNVGFLFQNPENQIFMTTVERDIAFSLEFRGFPREEMSKRVEWAMEVMGIKNLAHKRIEELSGGEKQKVALAGILALRPSILILDEPTAYLSPYSARELISLLKTFNERYDMTIILIDHRLDLVVEVAERILVMREGELQLDLSVDEAFKLDLSKEYGINVPTLIKIYGVLSRIGINLDNPPLTIENLIDILDKGLIR